MALSPGTRLGPYEILAAAGAGGMGEVYRARDTRLDRIVAIKVLPEAFLKDPGRRQRLEREARAVSSLSHPHICTLYDIGHQDGVDYLVMEYLEGETLADRLQRGPLPPDQALRHAMEIAGALDTAHRQGIVHRDLKPGNIMLTRTGAKLLDFGLAKAATAEAGANLTAQATLSKPITQEGTVIGTYQYMSPEQVEGKALDARSDIFSFGSVLYEMVTGRRAFAGASHISVASAILEKQPEPISAVRPLTPPALDHAVRTCLAKDPEDRWQTARDLLLELRWIGAAGPQTGMAAPEAAQGSGRERLAFLASGALAIALAIAAVGWWRATRTPPPQAFMRLSVEASPGSIIDRFAGANLALSPDGTRLVMMESDPAGNFHLAMRSLDQSQSVRVAGGDNAFLPFFSPDGEWLAFFADGKLKKVAIGGGAPVTLCDSPLLMRGGSWGDDGNIIASFDGGTAGLVRIPSGGGAPAPVPGLGKEDGGGSVAFPQVLPGSRAVLFTAYGPGTPEEGDIVVAALDTGERRTLHHGGSFGRYLPSGHLAFMQRNTLWAAPFDLGRLAMTGAPQPVLEEVNNDFHSGGDFAFSRAGTLVYVNSRIDVSFPYSIWWLDGSGQIRPLHVAPGLYENPRFSPDGKRLAFEMPTASSRADLWVKDLERDTMSRLTHLPGRSNWPAWTPDGKSIIFSSYQSASKGMYWTSADGSGDSQQLIDPGGAWQIPGAVSLDGKRVAYTQLALDLDRREIWTAPIDGDRDAPRLGEPESFPTGSTSNSFPAFSPDGRWLAYTSSESRADEVYVRPFPGPGGKVQISTGGGSHPIWSRTERKLYFLTRDWRIMAAGYTASEGSFVAERPRVWSDRSLAYLGGCYPYDLAPDGKRFAVVLDPRGTSEQKLIPTDSAIVLVNFLDELRRKVPPGDD